MSAEEPRALSVYTAPILLSWGVSPWIPPRTSLSPEPLVTLGSPLPYTAPSGALSHPPCRPPACPRTSSSIRLFLELSPYIPGAWHTARSDISLSSPTSQSSPTSVSISLTLTLLGGGAAVGESTECDGPGPSRSLFAPMSGVAGWVGKGISPSRWSLCSPSPGSRARSWPDISPRRHLISRFRPLSAVPDSPKANINTTSVRRFPRPSRPNALRSATTNIASPGSSRVKSQSISR